METYTFDLQRIFLGETPPLFYLEILIRTVVMFGYTLLILRFVGGRGAGVGQLSLFEFVIVVLLGSAAGDPMFQPDVPLLHGIFVITVVVILQRIIITVTNHSRKAEHLLEGKPVRLVADGNLDIDGMHRARLSGEEIYAQLRRDGIENLGEVRRAYLETDGHVSVFRHRSGGFDAGLPIVPEEETPYTTYHAHENVPETGPYACGNCGYIRSLEGETLFPACTRCEGHEWRKAQKVVETRA